VYVFLYDYVCWVYVSTYLISFKEIKGLQKKKRKDIFMKALMCMLPAFSELKVLDIFDKCNAQ
jgi:hypothetical protein